MLCPALDISPIMYRNISPRDSEGDIRTKLLFVKRTFKLSIHGKLTKCISGATIRLLANKLML